MERKFPRQGPREVETVNPSLESMNDAESKLKMKAARIIREFDALNSMMDVNEETRQNLLNEAKETLNSMESSPYRDRLEQAIQRCEHPLSEEEEQEKLRRKLAEFDRFVEPSEEEKRARDKHLAEMPSPKQWP